MEKINNEESKGILNEFVFISMDIQTQVSNLMKVKEKALTEKMFPGERKAYKLGVDTCIALLTELLETDNNEIIIQADRKWIGNRQEEWSTNKKI